VQANEAEILARPLFWAGEILMSVFGDTFQLGDEGIRYLFFFFPRVIPYNEIKSLRKVPVWKTFFIILTQPGYSTGSISLQVVLIETKQGFLIAGSPRKPDEFLLRVAQHREKSGGVVR
jgi:hypothetical protein